MATNYSIDLKAGFPQCAFNSQTGQFEQTWVYIITQTGPTQGSEISDFEIQLCDNHEVLSVSKNGDVVPISDAATLNIKVFNPPNANSSCLFQSGQNIRVIKWESLSNADVQPNTDPDVGQYDFTLAGCYEIGDINAAIKGGPDCDVRTIQGPTCQQLPPRGIDFSNITDIDITE